MKLKLYSSDIRKKSRKIFVTNDGGFNSYKKQTFSNVDSYETRQFFDKIGTLGTKGISFWLNQNSKMV